MTALTHTDPQVQSIIDRLRRTAGVATRQHRHPAEQHRALAHDPASAPLLTEAARVLLANSHDPAELELVAHLELAPTAELYAALLARLRDAATLPSGQGLRTGTLLGDLLERLIVWLPPGRDDLANEALALLDRAGTPEQRLALASRRDDAKAIIDRLAALPDRELHDAWLRALALLRVTQLAPDQVLAVARTLARTSEPERRRITTTLERGAATWMAAHRNELHAALGL